MYEEYLTHFEYEPMISDDCAIRLTKEPYKDITLYIGRQFHFLAEKGGLTFDYEIINYPPNFPAYLVNGEFDQLLGGIVMAIAERNGMLE